MKNSKDHYSLFIIALAILASTMLGCTQYNKTTIAQNDRIIYYQGNPLELIEESTQNRIPFITKENFKEFNNYILADAMVYQNVEELRAGIPQNTFSQIHSEYIHGGFQFQDLEAPYESFIFQNPSKQLALQMYVDSQENFNVASLYFNGIPHQVFPLHYSLANDKKTFSILLYSRTQQNTSLIALYFSKPSSDNTKPTINHNRQYKYLGVNKYSKTNPSTYKVRWEQKVIPLHICGYRAVEFQGVISNAVRQWNKVLKENVKIELSVLKNPPPFSDVNTSCIYLTNKFSYMHYSGMNHYQHYDGRIRPHSIFLYQDHQLDISTNILTYPHASKGVPYNNSAQVIETKNTDFINFLILHEIGHFIGLSHQFDLNHETVMSNRENKRDYITDYDKEAALNLYSD